MRNSAKILYLEVRTKYEKIAKINAKNCIDKQKRIVIFCLGTPEKRKSFLEEQKT